MSVELPMIIQGNTKEEIDFIGEAIYPLLTSQRQFLILEFLIERDGTMSERFHEYLEKPNDKIIFTKSGLPMEVESHLTEYIIVTLKGNEQGKFSIISRIKTQDFSKPRALKLKYNFPRMQSPKYNGHEQYEYLVYDERNKLKKSQVVKVTSLPELEQAVEFTTTRKLMRKTYGSMFGRALPYDETVIVFEVMVDVIDLPNETIGDYLEKIRKIADYTDVYIVALVTV